MLSPRAFLRLLPLSLICLAQPALASALRWEPAANGAAIVLPVPAQVAGSTDGSTAGITGGTLSCAKQSWTLRLRAGRDVANGQARLAIGESTLSIAATVSAGTIEVPLPASALALIKEGSELSVALGESGPGARFPLAGSRTAIAAAAPLCSPPDLAGAEPVRLAPDGPAREAARAATAEEAGLFREATSREPGLLAAFVPAGEGRQLLFASLCGSNRYYGETGCKLLGFAREGAGDEWKAAYESEGMHLFRDLKAGHGGWPDLLTVAAGGTGGKLRWEWRDGAYQVAEEPAIADGAPVLIDELRTGTTAE